MNDIVSVDDIRDMIKREHIRPDQLFSEEALKELTAAAEAKGYAAAVTRMTAEKRPAEAPKTETESAAEQTPEDKYIDPAQNDFIKT